MCTSFINYQLYYLFRTCPALQPRPSAALLSSWRMGKWLPREFGDPRVTLRCMWCLEERSQLYHPTSSLRLCSIQSTVLRAETERARWMPAHGVRFQACQASAHYKNPFSHLANGLDRPLPSILQGFVETEKMPCRQAASFTHRAGDKGFA